MRQPPKTEFYNSLPIQEDFDALANQSSYKKLPSDWLVGMADIVGSTALIEQGRYKVVNTIGAAVISAQINAAEDKVFPFVFGGDGAAFAFHAPHETKAREALAAVRRWAKDEFDVELRTVLAPVSKIREAGHNVTVARFKASENSDYAMFSGGGLFYLDQEMKKGHFDIPIAPVGTIPDLEGLSCRWSPIEAKNGKIISLVIHPTANGLKRNVSKLFHDVVRLTQSLDRGGHPVPVQGPGFSWPPEGLQLEAHATHGSSTIAKRKRQLLFETFIAWVFFKTGLKIGGFDANHYVRTSGANADFRKFDDGLKMTIDCDDATLGKILQLLDDAVKTGVVTYGLAEQQSALMTCIVPSVMRDDHMHFVDGADGGYAKAAQMMKQATPELVT